MPQLSVTPNWPRRARIVSRRPFKSLQNKAKHEWLRKSKAGGGNLSAINSSAAGNESLSGDIIFEGLHQEWFGWLYTGPHREPKLSRAILVKVLFRDPAGVIALARSLIRSSCQGGSRNEV